MQGFTLKLSQVQRKPNFDVKINEVNGSRNIGQGHRVKVKGMSRTITMQDFTLAGIIDAEKTKLRCKNKQSQWTVKYSSKALGQDACLKGISRTITMQGFTLGANTDAGKTKL